MRSLPILLLLICSFVADADATPKCDRSLIKGVDPSKLYSGETVACVGGENSLMAIEINSTRYESLSCFYSDGWRGLTLIYKGYETWSVKNDKVADLSTQLNIACVEYCAATGKGIKITKPSSIDIIILSCADKEEHLYYGQHRLSNDNAEVQCSLDMGWRSFKFMPNAAQKTTVKSVQFQFDNAKPAQFECKKDSMQSMYDDTNPPCDLSLIKGVDSSKIRFDHAFNTLTCIGGETSLMAIEFNSKRYESLTCDWLGGWKAKKRIDDGSKWGVEKIETVVEASAQLNIACVEYCVSSGDRIEVGKADNAIYISCPIQFKYQGKRYQEKLFHDQLRIYRASCRLGEFEWTFDTNPEGNEYVNRKEKFGKATQFECRIELPTAASTTIPNALHRRSNNETMSEVDNGPSSGR